MPGISEATGRRYPELERFDSPEEARRVLDEWRDGSLKSPRFWLTWAVATSLIGIVVTLVLSALRRWVCVPPDWVIWVVVDNILIPTATIIIMWTWLWRSRCRRFLRQALVDRHIPICLRCGYDLRGQSEPRCPECGTSFDPMR